MHPIITKGGDIVNIIPAEARLETYVRARTTEAIFDASHKVDRALRGAAVALGCSVEIETVPGYLPLCNDPDLGELFKDNAARIFGPDQYRDYPHGGGSTDAGDLSQIMPVLHPAMTGASGVVHGPDWGIADPAAGYLAPAKVLAMMAIDLLYSDASTARDILQNHAPNMSKGEYLQQQKAIFHRELFAGDQTGENTT